MAERLSVVFHGNMQEVLKTLERDSLDGCVTDPPYHLTSNDQGTRGFMGKSWDGGSIAFRPETWRLVYDVLKPGAHLCCFGGTRTFHRMAVAIEDAGFEIRDTLFWLYGTGFPKSLNPVPHMIKLAVCQSSENAPLAAQSSKPIRLVSSEGRTLSVVALAVILPAGVPALIMEIGREVGLSVLTDMLLSELETLIGLNMTWSWNGSLGDASTDTSKCITGTTSVQTIDLKTWNWLRGLLTHAITMPRSGTLPDGSPWPVATARDSSLARGAFKTDTLIVTALGSAMWNPVVKYSGTGSALKPAVEPIILARKPLIGTVAQNVLAHGVGGLNIDGCRVPCADKTPFPVGANSSDGAITTGLHSKPRGDDSSPDGRWPANILHDGSDEVLEAFARFGNRPSTGMHPSNSCGTGHGTTYLSKKPQGRLYEDAGTAARFFNSLGYSEEELRLYYSSKANKRDRAGSKHPTVKPISLLRWLCKLICPPGATVLDPFAGSGTTAAAASAEGLDSVLVEQEPEYIEDIRRRVSALQGVELFMP